MENQIFPQNQNEGEMRPSLGDLFEGDDIKEVSYNFFPSFIYMFLISFCLLSTDFTEIDLKNVNQPKKVIATYPYMRNYLKLLFIIYSLYMLKGIIFFFIVKKEKKHEKKLKIFKSIFSFILDILFFVTTILGYYCFKLLTLNFIIGHIYLCIFVFFLIFSGFTHIGLFVFNLIFLIFAFFWFLNNFNDNEKQFLETYGLGENEDIVSYLKKVNYADKNTSHYNENQCSICLEFFNKGENIAELGCHHIFHIDCIGKWLTNKAYCPCCRDTNIFKYY